MILGGCGLPFLSLFTEYHWLKVVCFLLSFLKDVLKSIHFKTYSQIVQTIVKLFLKLCDHPVFRDKAM